MSAEFLLLCAAGLLILPLRWVAAAVLAAAIHEVCHIGAARFCGYRIQCFGIESNGMELVTGQMIWYQAVLCLAAGPAGSLACLLFRCYPELAFCGALQGIFNLLPIPPLDGGRMVRILTDRFCTAGRADMLCAVLKWSAVLTVTVAVLCLSAGFHWGGALLILLPIWKNALQ